MCSLIQKFFNKCLSITVHVGMSQVVQIMVPLRHEFIQFGGSWAQRQVFNFTIIQAAIKTNNLSLAIGLVAEMMVRMLHTAPLSEVGDISTNNYVYIYVETLACRYVGF